MPNWRHRLSYPLYTRSGAELRTLAGSRDFVLALEPGRTERSAWQEAARCLLAAAEGGSIPEATRAMHRALLVEMMLDVRKTQLPP